MSLKRRKALDVCSAGINKDALFGPGCFGHASDAATVSTWAQQLCYSILGNWEAHLETQLDTLEKACLATTLIGDKNLLTDKRLQTALFEHPHRSSLGKLQKEHSETLHSFKSIQEEGVQFTADLRSAIKDGVALKKRCKAAVGVDWLPDQILNTQPTSKAGIPAWAKGLRTTIRSKGIEIPDLLLIA